MYCVYILKSSRNPEQVYIGFTTNLFRRLREQNTGRSPHTKRYFHWKIVTFVAFEDRHLAERFEKYLKGWIRKFLSKAGRSPYSPTNV